MSQTQFVGRCARLKRKECSNPVARKFEEEKEATGALMNQMQISPHSLFTVPRRQVLVEMPKELEISESAPTFWLQVFSNSASSIHPQNGLHEAETLWETDPDFQGAANDH